MLRLRCKLHGGKTTGYVFEEISHDVLSCFLYTFGKADSAGGADEAAKMASDTFGAEDARLAVRIKTDCLVAAVHTRDITSPATDTLLAVNHRINHRLSER